VSSDREKLECIGIWLEVGQYIKQDKRDPAMVAEILKPIINEPNPKLSGAVVLLYDSMTIGEKSFCREAMLKALRCECGDPMDGCRGTCHYSNFYKYLKIWNGEKISSKNSMYSVMLRAFKFAMCQNSALQQIVLDRFVNLI